MAKSKTIRELANKVGVSDSNMDRLENMMGTIDDVLKGRRERPGGFGCAFPHCSCNLPWEKCERKISR
jgi:hypothetical protein